MVKVSNNLKKIRKQKGITQEELALKINVTRQAVSNWENNKSLPDIHSLQAISEALGVELEELVYGKKKEDISTEKLRESKEHSFKIILSVFGVLFFSTGLFIILAFFWDAISPTVKAPISFLPFIVGAAVLFAVFFKKYDSLYLREGSAFFYTAGTVSTLFLINNTFESVFEIDVIFLLSAVFIIPVIFIMDSVSPLIVYYVFISVWFTMQVYNVSFLTALIIPLFAAGVLFTVLLFKKQQEKRHKYSSWITVICFCYLYAVLNYFIFETSNNLPVIYAAAGMYLLKDIKVISSAPLRILGSVFVLILGIWADAYIGFTMDDSESILACCLGLAIFAVCAITMFRKYKSNIYDKLFVIILSFKILVMTSAEIIPLISNKINGEANDSFYYSSTSDYSIVYFIIIDIFAIAIDFLFVFSGIKELDFFKVNLGIIASYIAIIYNTYYIFDMDFWIFGIICIIFGASLFAVNYLMTKKKNSVLKEVAENE